MLFKILKNAVDIIFNPAGLTHISSTNVQEAMAQLDTVITSGGGGGVSFGGETTCSTGCTIGGKAFTFYASNESLSLSIKVGFDIAITSGSDSIQLHKWSQEPNTNLNGREFVCSLSATGGSATVTIDSTYRWISIFAQNPANNNFFDGVCFRVDGSILTLVSF